MAIDFKRMSADYNPLYLGRDQSNDVREQVSLRPLNVTVNKIHLLEVAHQRREAEAWHMFQRFYERSEMLREVCERTCNSFRI